jgi:hypothetical protein
MPGESWRDTLGVTEKAKTGRAKRASPEPTVDATKPSTDGKVIDGRFHKYPPAYCLDINTKKHVTLCCICNARDPTDRYIVTLQGKVAGDSAAVEAAYEKLTEYARKLK